LTASSGDQDWAMFRAGRHTSVTAATGSRDLEMWSFIVDKTSATRGL
jgi:hypothetical protein